MSPSSFSVTSMPILVSSWASTDILSVSFSRAWLTPVMRMVSPGFTASMAKGGSKSGELPRLNVPPSNLSGADTRNDVSSMSTRTPSLSSMSKNASSPWGSPSIVPWTVISLPQSVAAASMSERVEKSIGTTKSAGLY